MKKFSKKGGLILIILGVLILAGSLIGRGIYLPANLYSQDQIIFNIEKGQGLTEISSNLERQGLIRSKFLFELYALLQNSAKSLQAGRYNLTASMSASQILNKLIQGETIKEKITIIEGWDLRDIAWYFENKGMFQAEELFELTGFPAVDYLRTTDLPPLKDFSEKFEFLKEKPENVGLEGYLFPDTYEITPGEGVEEIARKMLQNFDEKITQDIREEIKTQEKTLFEILTMASILEKEVKTYEDRQIAAGILWKRLKMGWPIQADATLTYLTGKESLSLTKDDLKIDSPYNTYKYYGLPRGPICSPGLESIKAAVYYKESPHWFYLTTNDGETIFSKTLEEHNINRFKYLK